MDRSRRPGDRSGRQWPRQLLASSDEQLVELVLAGDDIAFELLFDRHVADAVWFAREVLGSWSEAEDAVRHSFAAAYAYLAARDRGIEFGPWLQTILGNHCLSIVQARGPRPPEGAQVVDLGEWRSRRRRLGVALPLAPFAGLREGLMALGGLGTGAAATGGASAGGASLIAGTLAKVAVAALLVGGAGVAGNAASERDPAERAALVETARDSRPGPSLVVAPPGGDGFARLRERGAGELRHDERAGRHVALVPPTVEPGADVPPGDAPVGEVPPAAVPVAAPAPSTPGGPAVVPTPAASGGATAIAEPAKLPLETVEKVTGEQIPAALEELAPPVPPHPPGLEEIGDDLSVTTDRLTDDLRTLLSQGTTPAPE